jgi:hypothetical protein
MHSCPRCWQACYCDLEDHAREAPEDCQHECEEAEDDDMIEIDKLEAMR